MPITPLSRTALMGIQYGMQGMRKNALEIASADNAAGKLPTRDMVRSMVELHRYEHHTAASIKAFKTADELIGSLLDIKA